MKKTKKIIVPLLTLLLAINVVVPSLSALNFDPSKPPITLQNQSNTPTGDDDPFSVDKVIQDNDTYSFNSICYFITIKIHFGFFNNRTERHRANHLREKHSTKITIEQYENTNSQPGSGR